MKKVLAFTLIGIMSLSTSTVALGATHKAVPTSSSIYVNGKTVDFDAYNINGNNYFKIRDLAEAIKDTTNQFEVAYNSADKSVKLQSNTAYTTVGGELCVGSGATQTAVDSDSKFYKDGDKIALTSYVIGGNNYTKLRDIGDMFGLNIGWEKSSSSIVIISSNEYKERDTAYTEAGFTEYQKTAAENYVIYEGYTVEEAIKEVKAIGVPKEAVKSNTVKTPTTTTQSKPATTTQSKPATTTPSSSSSGVTYDSDGFPTTGGLSQASINANGGDTSKLGDPTSPGSGSTGTAEGDKGLN